VTLDPVAQVGKGGVARACPLMGCKPVVPAAFGKNMFAGELGTDNGVSGHEQPANARRHADPSDRGAQNHVEGRPNGRMADSYLLEWVQA